MMGKMKTVISMRLHALIFAAGLGVPLVGVVYDPKVSGFLDYLDQKRYMSLDAVSTDSLYAMAEQALSEGINGVRAGQLRALAEENEAAARQLLEEQK